MNALQAINEVWGILTWLLAIAFALGGLFLRVVMQARAQTEDRGAWKEAMEREARLREDKWEDQRAINKKLFQYHDEHQKEMLTILRQLQNGGIAVHECPLGKVKK
jgi:hypothetical protein